MYWKRFRPGLQEFQEIHIQLPSQIFLFNSLSLAKVCALLDSARALGTLYSISLYPEMKNRNEAELIIPRPKRLSREWDKRQHTTGATGARRSKSKIDKYHLAINNVMPINCKLYERKTNAEERNETYLIFHFFSIF